MSRSAGVVAGGGWAFECGHRIVVMRVTVGGATLVEDYNVAWVVRPDVAAAYGECASTAGYNFTFDTSSLAAGSYPVVVEVIDDQGLTNVSNALTLTVLP